jgi:hypothetical protein
MSAEARDETWSPLISIPCMLTLAFVITSFPLPTPQSDPTFPSHERTPKMSRRGRRVDPFPRKMSHPKEDIPRSLVQLSEFRTQLNKEIFEYSM